MNGKARIWREGGLQGNSTSIVGVLVLLFCIGRLVWMARIPEIELIKFIPDDAFYYFILAKNFSLEQRWTFDGHAPASGFHLLWGYLLAVVFFVCPNITWQSIFIVMGVVGSITFSMAASLVAATVKRLVGVSAVYGVTFVFLGSSSIIQPALMMETPLVSFFAAALFFIAFRETQRIEPGLILLAGAIGLLGMLSRSDFGLLPLVFFCVSAFVLRDSRMARLTFSALIGALIGLAVVVAHTYWISGELAPASGQIKSHWAQVDGISIKPGYEILLALIIPFFRLGATGWQSQYGFLLMLTLLGFTLYVALTNRNRRRTVGISISAVFAIVGYLLFYRYNGALQIWYAGSFLIPLSILFGIAISALCVYWPFLAACAVFVASAYSYSLSLSPLWPWQSSMLRGGIYLKEHPIKEPVGAWNAGIVRYFADRQIINLDGLVNDDVLQYVKSGRLCKYVASRQIEYVMDFPFMLSGVFSESHGYSDGELIACLSPEHTIPSASPEEQFGGELTLYKIRRDCLR